MVGESDLHDGKKYIIFDDGNALVCLKFDKETGQGKIKWILQDY